MIYGFPPIERSDARILILGSMPSIASLSLQQYYGHPRNAFWPIMSRMLGESVATYEDKRELLISHHIALWDVVQACEREGSLDCAIMSPVPNDIAGFLASHPDLKLVCFNGKAASSLYRRYVGLFPDMIEFKELPSTSPANTMPFERKFEAFAMACGEILR
ncbi:MAG: DNA-deoxyinosine glycosylase [Sphaerochaetaceae bacterium]|nr:DNA-deoxyinosine glycosylase [Sphaerochaetaceae bacterium]